MEYLETWGTLIHERKLKSKISCQAPFKSILSSCTVPLTVSHVRYTVITLLTHIDEHSKVENLLVE
jgi:hypothetical protein